MFGHNSFTHPFEAPNGWMQPTETFAATATIPSLKEIYENGHPYIESFTIGSSATGVSFPEDDIIQITGHDGTYSTGSDYDPVTKGQIQHYGTFMRIRAIPGYQVNVSGFVGDGYGKTIPSYDLPYKRTIFIIGPDGTRYMPTSGTGESGSGGGSGSGSGGGAGGSGGGTGGGSITPCADPNRKTNTDGSCGADCKDGYEPNTAPNSSSECIAVASSDPNDCASENRAVNTDTTCGDCLSGYTEDTAGDCIADEPEEEEKGINWLLWGGAVVVIGALFVL